MLREEQAKSAALWAVQTAVEGGSGGWAGRGKVERDGRERSPYEESTVVSRVSIERRESEDTGQSIAQSLVAAFSAHD